MSKLKASTQGQLRIIGGEWRSRKVCFMDAEGLRPTPDRVRETLFNWLAPYIEGAHLLDAYTGSGALFLEALSRGAATATVLDVNRQVIDNLKQQLQLLNCDSARLIHQDALTFLKQSEDKKYDVVFLDPPFRKNLLEETCHLLENNHWLTNEAWIYTESEQAPSTLKLPLSWCLHREKKAGQVFYTLWRRRIKKEA